MEKKKRKLKTHYKIAIVLGILYGPVMCIQIANSPLLLSYSEYAVAYHTHYPYYEEYELSYNPRTFHDDVVNGVPDLFYESYLDDDSKRMINDSFFVGQYSEEFIDKLPGVVFQQVFDDDLSGWTLMSIESEIGMSDMNIEYVYSIEFDYIRSCTYKGKYTNWFRTIEYSSPDSAVYADEHVWGPGSPPDPTYQAPEYISLSEALQIANENGGKQFVEEMALQTYPLRIERYFEEWRVHYNERFAKIGSTYDVTINAITGEVIKTEQYIPEGSESDAKE